MQLLDPILIYIEIYLTDLTLVMLKLTIPHHNYKEKGLMNYYIISVYNRKLSVCEK